MKTQYRIINIGKGILSLTPANLHKVNGIETPDSVLEFGEVVLAGLNVSIQPNEFKWRLNQVVFNNLLFSTTITQATDGFYRSDLLQVTSDNIIRIKKGVENATASTTPTPDPGYLPIGSVNIFGANIVNTSVIDVSHIRLFGNGGATDFLPLNSSASNIIMHNATSINGFNMNPLDLYFAKDYYIRNNTGNPLTLKSAQGTNNIRFYFNGNDLVIPVNNNAHFKFLGNGEFGGIGYFTFVGILTDFSVYEKIADNNVKLLTKVDKESGKSLLSDAEILRLSTVTNQDLSTKIDKTDKGIANGVGSLDGNGKQPLSQVNDAILGNLKWYGLYNGTTVTGSPITALNGNALPSPSIGNVGWYFIANGDFLIGGVDYKTGDWLISDGTSYVKVDNTDAVSSVAGLTGVVSVESLRIALNNVTNISIQDVNGIEKFKLTDTLRLESVSFNPATKTISIDSLVPLAAFLDTVNGSDVTGSVENSKKPFKTIEALFNALPPTQGETYTIYLIRNTVSFKRRIIPRNINWISYFGTNLDFSVVKLDNEVTDSVDVFTQGSSYNWNFSNENINIVCNYVGERIFNSAVSITGTIGTLDWKSYGFYNYSPVFYTTLISRNSNFKIKNAIQSNQVKSATLLCITGEVKVEKMTMTRAGNFWIGRELSYARGVITIGSIVQIGNEVLEIQMDSASGQIPPLTVGNININGSFRPQSSLLTLFGSIGENTSINFSGTSVVTGTIISNHYFTNSFMANNLEFRNFKGKLGRIDVFNVGSVTLSNSDIETQGEFIGAGYNLTRAEIFYVTGFSTITQKDTTKSLIQTYGIGLPSRKPVVMAINGTLKTNATSYGLGTSYNQPSSTFKEKLKEVVIRSKIDIVNRALDSTMNYIIDGTIELLPTESIIVPIGGLSLSGYGFDVSAIKATGNNSTLFTSPIEGSGNLFTQNISMEASGAGSKVFNLINAGAATGGADAIELGVVNFDNCTSLGTLKNFRQGLWDNIGAFGCKDGLTFEGVWSGGFRADLVIVRNFGVAGVGGTLFKAGADLLFKSRFLTDINADFKAGGNLSDFTAANFNTTKLYQVKAAQVTRGSVLDDTQNYTGTLSAFSPECDWSGNNGMKNSNLHPYGIATDKMRTYANDVDAASGGVVIGEVYVEATTGYFKTRLT